MPKVARRKENQQRPREDYADSFDSDSFEKDIIKYVVGRDFALGHTSSSATIIRQTET
jgi:hypothetical protein